MIKKITLLILILILLPGCKSLQDGLSLKKKENVDEFLIEKKNPLVLPPEYSKLPKPIDEKEETIEQDDEIDFSKVLKKKKSTNLKKSSSDLEKSISNVLNQK